MIKSFTFLVIGFLILGILFFIFKPKDNKMDKVNRSEAVSVVDVKNYEFQIEKNKVIKGPRNIRVKKGDELSFKVLSDEDDEIHLHGYDKLFKLKSGVISEFLLVATISGRFELELHHSEIPLSALEVLPD